MTNHLSAKLIKSLHQKKYRQETKKFLVEGDKGVVELLESDFKVESLYATKEFIKTNTKLLAEKKIRPWPVDADELQAMGTLERNTGALAIAFQKPPVAPQVGSGITLVLDDVRDPGNLGTLIRIADWYGISTIICSNTCVDWYNPKVISATMGSFTRVGGFYTDLPAFLSKQSKLKVPIIGAFLVGESTHKFAFPESGILVIGSESHGISKEVSKLISAKVTIPRYGKAESLNAAVAGGIVLDAWKAKN
jgi:TrmH family RNA methyltransferase